jgi:hypothetical protein
MPTAKTLDKIGILFILPLNQKMWANCRILASEEYYD